MQEQTPSSGPSGVGVPARCSTDELLNYAEVTSEALALVDAPITPQGPTRFVWHALDVFFLFGDEESF